MAAETMDIEPAGISAAANTLLYDVAYADTDAGGIVYHGRYVEMAERSRNHALKALGVPVAGMRTRFGVLFVIRDIRATYHRPSFVGDTLALWSGIVTATPVRVIWRTTIDRGPALVCDVEAQVVAFDPVSRHPCLLPAELMMLLDLAPRSRPMRRMPMMKADAG
jgi:acyl-CoA thioester hydrolase